MTSDDDSGRVALTVHGVAGAVDLVVPLGASAADVVVLPTPPEPVQTMIRVAGSSMRASTSRSGAGDGWAASGP